MGFTRRISGGAALPRLQALAGMVLLLSLFNLLAANAAAQLPAGAELIPPGFTLEGETDTGGTKIVDATRPNENFPKPHQDDGIGLRITWSMNAMPQQIVEMMAQAPEDPASETMGSLNEPCGRERHEGGVLNCRRVTRPWIGAGEGPDLVTYRIGWMGAVSTGLIAVEINNLFGDPAAATGWIDGIIARIRSKGFPSPVERAAAR